MKIRDIGTLAFMLTAALLIGCGEEAATEEAPATSTAELKGSGYCGTSFTATCNGNHVSYSGKAVITAGSNSCKRADGSWGGRTQWAGHCTGDVSNNNGHLQCN